MAEEITLGSVKRFGARYGRKPKLRYSAIEKEQRRFHKCPYCHNIKVKRVVLGIWQCRKCNAKFAGKAYSVAKKISLEEESPQVSAEQTEQTAEIIATEGKS